MNKANTATRRSTAHPRSSKTARALATTSTTFEGYTIRNKVYNKIVSNYEAGEIRGEFGCHLADYVACTNTHLRPTFHHSNVQARGCNMIDVSVYGLPTTMLDANRANKMLAPELTKLAAPKFVVQTPSV